MYLPASKMQTGERDASAIPQMIILRFWLRKSSAYLIYVYAHKFEQKANSQHVNITILVHEIRQSNKQMQVQWIQIQNRPKPDNMKLSGEFPTPQMKCPNWKQMSISEMDLFRREFALLGRFSNWNFTYWTFFLLHT